MLPKYVPKVIVLIQLSFEMCYETANLIDKTYGM